MEDELISRNRLYEHAKKLEDEAYEKLEGVRGDIISTVVWNAILAERTAFKHDIADAPKVKRR